MAHLFVSYSRKDIDFAGKIVDALSEKKLDAWIDWKSIPKGEYWELCNDFREASNAMSPFSLFGRGM